MPKYFGGGSGGGGPGSPGEDGNPGPPGVGLIGPPGPPSPDGPPYAIDSSDVANRSTVAGSSVTRALDTLSTITPTPIATGSNITGSGTVTITPSDDFGRYVITSLSGDMELHLAVTGTPALQGLCIERTDTSAFTVTVVNDGPAGPGGPVGGPNLYVFPGSVKRSSSFIFDAADWNQGINLPLA